MKTQILTSFALVAAVVGAIVWQEYREYRRLQRMKAGADARRKWMEACRK